MTTASVRITPARVAGQWMLDTVSRIPRFGPGTLFSAAGAILLFMMLQVSTGWSGVATGAAMAAIPVGLLYGVKRYPQVTGVAASSLLWVGLLAVSGLTLSPFVIGGGVPPFVIVYAVLLAAVTSVVFLSPRAGIHVGWSVMLAQATMMAPLPLSVFLPGSIWEVVAVPAAFVTAVTFVRRRARKATRKPAKTTTRQRIGNVARGFGFSLVILIGATSVMSVSPPEANALPSFGIGDFFEDKANDLICSFTRPDLTGETVGTGPEGFIPSKNLGQVKRSETEENADEVPGWSDQAGDYDRLGQNNAMDAYTLYEIAGLRGIKWVNWQKDQDGKEKCSIMPWASVMVGNLIFKVSTYVLQVTIALKEWSQSSNPLQFLYDKTTPLVADLFNYLFLPMAGIMFMLAALMVAIRAMGNGGSREALGNVGGSAVALFLAGLLYGGIGAASWTQPDGNGFFMVAKFADETVGQMNSGIAEIAFKSLDSTTGNEMMCQPPQDLPSNTEGSESQAAVPGQRYSSCILAEALAYRPWARGQFGSVANNPMLPAEKTTRFGNPSLAARGDPEITSDDDPEGQGLPCYNNYRGCEDLRTYLIAQEGGPDITTARAHCLNDKSDWKRLVQCDPYHAVAYQLGLLEKSDDAATEARANRALYAYRAQGSMPHVSQAFAALIGTICVTAGIAAIAAITLWWHAMLFVMFLLGVLKLLWAAYPGKISIAKEYVLDCMNTFGMRLAYGVLSTLMILLIAIVFASSLNTGLKILWSVFVLTMMWKALKKVQDVATIKGSTTQGPAGQVSKTGMIGAGLAGYGIAKVGSKAASGSAKMGGRAVRGTARHYRGPNGAKNAGKPALAAPDNNKDSNVTSGTGRRVMGAGAKVTKAVGRGAGVMTSPAHGPVRERAQRVSLGTRATAARTRRTVGSAVTSSAPVSRLTDVAASTRQGGAAVMREGRGVVAAVVPRAYASEMTESQREWVDEWTGRSRIGGNRRTTASAHEQQQFVSRMRTDRMARRRENYEAGRRGQTRRDRPGNQ